MDKIFLLSFIVGLIMVSCTDPNTIGLEVQPTSDNIIISSANFEEFNFSNESEDSLRTDEASNVLLGEIEYSEFGKNKGGFYTQILLSDNNIELGTNPVVDSVVLLYTYSGYYGDLEKFDTLEITYLTTGIDLDTVYYSNYSDVFEGNSNADNWVESFSLSIDEENPFLKVKLDNKFGQDILNLGTQGKLVDNQTFIQEFNGMSILAEAKNTMLYLNPEGTNSHLKIYYKNDESTTDTLSLDFVLGGDAARINLFNEKNQNSIIEDKERIYIQSMAGYKANINIGNLDQIKDTLKHKVVNNVTITFDVEISIEGDDTPHDMLFLTRVKEDGTYLKSFTNSDVGVNIFIASLSESGYYQFDITKYFYQLLNDDTYTNGLYLLADNASINANRTILNKDIKLKIYYSEL